jgi:hypothetical protein
LFADGDRWWFENEDNGLFTKQQAKALKKDTTIAGKGQKLLFFSQCL